MIKKIRYALHQREELLSFLHAEKTDCYRLFHGAIEGIAGLTIDRYGEILLLQTWREELDPHQAQDIADDINRTLDLSLIPIWNHRQKRGHVIHHPLRTIPSSPIGTEFGIQYCVDPIHEGIDPLLFLDFRSARRWILHNSRDKTVLNLFAYTCGIGISACIGGAKEVYNIDFSQRSLDFGRKNARQNQIELQEKKTPFLTIKDDVFAVIRQFSGLGIKGRAAKRPFIKRTKQQFDIVVLDPPRMAQSPFGKVDIVQDYPALFKPALLCTKPNGWILATNNVASVEEQSWKEQLLRCAHKAGVSIQQMHPIRPEADFPSPDQNWPLKMLCIQIG